MRRGTPLQELPETSELAIPGHLARYAAEVDAWRLEALVYRATRASEIGSAR